MNLAAILVFETSTFWPGCSQMGEFKSHQDRDEVMLRHRLPPACKGLGMEAAQLIGPWGCTFEGIFRCCPWPSWKIPYQGGHRPPGFGKLCSLEGKLAPALVEKGHPTGRGGQAASPVSQQMLFPGTPSRLCTHHFGFLVTQFSAPHVLHTQVQQRSGQALSGTATEEPCVPRPKRHCAPYISVGIAFSQTTNFGHFHS